MSRCREPSSSNVPENGLRAFISSSIGTRRQPRSARAGLTTAGLNFMKAATIAAISKGGALDLAQDGVWSASLGAGRSDGAAGRPEACGSGSLGRPGWAVPVDPGHAELDGGATEGGAAAPPGGRLPVQARHPDAAG